MTMPCGASQALAVCLLIILLFFGQVVIASFVAPALPAASIMGTPTVSLLASPDSTSAAMTGKVTPAPSAAADGASRDASGCVPGEIVFTFPESGEQVSGVVELTGTVNIQNFGFYKYEAAPANTGVWTTISAGRGAVVDGNIGRWDATALTPGDYQLRLVVIDNAGQELPHCVISVQVVAP